MGQQLKNSDSNTKNEKHSKNGTNVPIYEKVNLILSEFVKKFDAIILENCTYNENCFLICNQFGYTIMSILLPIFKRNKITFYISYDTEIQKCMLVLYYKN